MSIPIVAIVGRANVGKSTLLNRLTGQRIAITEDLPGTTRDRIFAPVEWRGVIFNVVDTGGIETNPDSTIAQVVNEQVDTAISDADLVIFLLDSKSGITSVDENIAQKLRRSNKRVIIAANKADNENLKLHAVEFYELGLGEPLVISAYHNKGTDELLDGIIKDLPEQAEQKPEEPSVKVAIVGRANVGKSTLLNALLGQKRAIVSDMPHTTRDSFDTPIDFGGNRVVLIDTAGIRRRGRIEKGVENYSVIRTLKSIDRADVVILVFDTSEFLTAQDIHIAGYIHQASKGSVLVANKCDLFPDLRKTELSSIIKDKLKFMPYLPVLFVSAKEQKGLKAIMPKVLEVHQQRLRRIPTAEVNAVLRRAVAKHSPSKNGGRQLKAYYATQTGVNPPTFVVFVNNSQLVHFSYERYLENQFREHFNFTDTPIKLVFKNRGEK